MNDHADTLRKIRATIADKPLECLGIGQADGRAWPIRDEVVYDLDKIIAVLEAGRSSDWVLVPREPTEAMRIAGEEALSPGDYSDPPSEDVYAAMLAAAPQQPPPDPDAVIRDDTRFWLVPDPDKDEKVELTLGLFISDPNKSDAYLQYASQDQQPPLVGVPPALDDDARVPDHPNA